MVSTIFQKANGHGGKYNDFANADLDELLASMQTVEKISLLGGADWWTTVPIPRLGIPYGKMSDGPNGVRGASHFKSTPAQCIPCATALAATWNMESVAQMGDLLAKEALAKGSTLILAPTCNIQRSPLGGRSFECFSEDPFLSGMTAAAYVNGLQDAGVGATIKHFVANDQEHERRSVNSSVSERALREIYLMPFMIAQRLAKPWAYMTSYGRLDFVHCSENKRLLRDILRNEWGFDGLVVSDWCGVYSTAGALKAGLDLEMPGSSVWRGKLLHDSLLCGKVDIEDIDKCARAVLQFVQRSARASPQAMELPIERSLDSPEDKARNRRVAAEAAVLLKNEGAVLPLDPKKLKRLAIIGPNAKARVYSGGGSASLNAQYVVTPFEGITNALPQDVEVSYEVGCHSHRFVPLLDGQVKLTSDEDAELGWNIEFHNQDPTLCESPAPVLSVVLNESRIRLNDTLPAGVAEDNFYLRSTGYYTADRSGIYQFGLTVVGKVRLYVNDKLLIEVWDKQSQGTAFYGRGSSEEIGEIYLTEGVPVKIHMEFNNQTPLPVTEGQPVLMFAAYRLGAVRKIDSAQAILDAVAIAEAADAVVLVCGTNMDWESEGSDRDSLALPGLSDKLIRAIAKANPKTIVVNQSGSAISMPWVDEVPVIVQAWFAGCEMGNAIADILLGHQNPSGKLPLTFPKREQDIPAFNSFKSEHKNVYYSEGLYVGYKWYESRLIDPLFVFGHGLSYTEFSYSNLRVAEPTSPLLQDGYVTVQFEIRNVGSVAGSETAQVYVSDTESLLHRPEKELKGFSKVFLEAGETKTVEVRLDKRSFAFYDDKPMRWRMESGAFVIRVGRSSRDIVLEETLILKEDGTWVGL